MKTQTYVCCIYVLKGNGYATIYNGKDRSDVQLFGTFTEQVAPLIVCLEQNAVKQIAPESTGIYWVPVWDMRKEKGFWLTLVTTGSLNRCPVVRVM